MVRGWARLTGVVYAKGRITAGKKKMFQTAPEEATQAGGGRTTMELALGGGGPKGRKR